MSFLVKYLSERGELLSALQGGCHGMEVEAVQKEIRAGKTEKVTGR